MGLETGVLGLTVPIAIPKYKSEKFIGEDMDYNIILLVYKLHTDVKKVSNKT